ncbi:MAG: hemerythrin domain-containing protein [Erythrobacter sp.]|nr:hemerythrin domain-containing protein [Erythrobacter sp.]
MSFLDRLAASVTPAASDEQRVEARSKIESMVPGAAWLGAIVDQHKEIESLFAEARAASVGADRRETVRKLSSLLTGHATAEEAVVYPIMSEDSGKTHAAMAYEEHAMTKIQLSKLERMDPMSEEWAEKLEHIQSAVQQHIYQEEHSWLPDLVDNTPDHKKIVLNRRFAEEFNRYRRTADAV